MYPHTFGQGDIISFVPLIFCDKKTMYGSCANAMVALLLETSPQHKARE